MTLFTLEGQADGALLEWNAGGTGTGFAEWNAAGDSTYVADFAVSDTHYMKRTTNPLPGLDSISVVEVFGRVAKSFGGADNSDYKEAIRLFGGSSGSGTSHNITSDAYTENSHDFISSKPGGGDWEHDDFGAIEWGVVHGTGTLTGTLRCSHAWLEVTGIESVGGFLWNIGCALSPMLGLAGGCLSDVDIAAMFARDKTRPTERLDFEAVMDAFRVRPRYA